MDVAGRWLLSAFSRLRSLLRACSAPTAACEKTAIVLPMLLMLFADDLHVVEWLGDGRAGAS